jgi:hypothetical protein
MSESADATTQSTEPSADVKAVFLERLLSDALERVCKERIQRFLATQGKERIETFLQSLFDEVFLKEKNAESASEGD